MLPDVAILIVTYNRANTLIETLNALNERILYSGKVHFVIADDGSDDGTQEAVVKWIAQKHRPPTKFIQFDRGGLGRNTNNGLRYAFTLADYVMQLQDDMRLELALALDPHVIRLEDYPQDGFIRLWGVGGHKYNATLDESYWRIHWNSPELYIPSDRPHLKHRRFHDVYGYYPEGLKTGDTEETWCHQVRDKALKTGGPSVLVPHSAEVERNFIHVGHDRWRDKGL